MPMTAAERLLHDPFDPVEALQKSAEFLRDLWAQFGNLGLAAAAYNAGPQRVRDWLGGKRTLPSETQTYVRIVTGHSVQEWARPDKLFWRSQFPERCPAVRLRIWWKSLNFRRLFRLRNQHGLLNSSATLRRQTP